MIALLDSGTIGGWGSAFCLFYFKRSISRGMLGDYFSYRGEAGQISVGTSDLCETIRNISS